MRFFKILIKTFVFIAGAAVSLWMLMPWGQLGEYAVLSAERMASEKGFTSRHSSVTGSWMGPKIEINGFSSKMPLGGGEFAAISVTPSFLQSVLRLSPVISVAFSGGKLSFPGAADTDLGSGSFQVSLRSGVVALNNVRNTGELQLNGDMEIDLSTERIGNADLMIKAPEKIEQALVAVKNMNMLPLVQESAGQWRLKREITDE